MDVLEHLTQPLEKRFDWNGSDEGLVLWREDCVKNFSGLDRETLRKVADWTIANRQYRTYPTVGDLTKAIKAVIPPAPRHEKGTQGFKAILAHRAEQASSYAVDFVTSTERGAMAREEGWDRSCRDHVRSIALRYLNEGNALPDFSEITIPADALAYYRRHGVTFGDEMWRFIGGSQP